MWYGYGGSPSLLIVEMDWRLGVGLPLLSDLYAASFTPSARRAVYSPASPWKQNQGMVKSSNDGLSFVSPSPGYNTIATYLATVSTFLVQFYVLAGLALSLWTLFIFFFFFFFFFFFLKFYSKQ